MSINNNNFKFSAYCGVNRIFDMEINNMDLYVSYINDDYFKLFPNEKIRLEYVKKKFKEFIKFNNDIHYESAITLLSIYKPEFMDKDMILLWKFKKENCNEYSEEMLNGSIIDKKYVKTLNIGNLSMCTCEDYFNIIKDVFNKLDFNINNNEYFKRFLNSIYYPQQPMSCNNDSLRKYYDKNIDYGYGDNENFDLIMKLDSNIIEQLESLFKHKKGR